MPSDMDSTQFDFTRITDQVYTYQPVLSNGQNTVSIRSIKDPDVIVIYGWGDAGLRHVSKYTAGFHSLFPHAKIIAVLSPILKAMTMNLDQRVKSMRPVVEETFREGDGSIQQPSATPKTVLMHVMSNTGGMNLGATLEAYNRLYNRPMPHSLLVLDSCPGSTEYTPANVRRFAFAMTVGTAKFFPWPSAMTQWIWFVVLYIIHGLEILFRRESAADFAVKATNSELLADKNAARMYLYSKEDAIIGWEDIELNAKDATQKGYKVNRTVFEGTPHVGHMRVWPEEYWKTILQAWTNHGGDVKAISLNSDEILRSASLSKAA